MDDTDRVMLRTSWAAATSGGGDVREDFSKEEDTRVETSRLRISQLCRAGRTSRVCVGGERIMVAKVQGRNRERFVPGACGMGLGRWCEASLRDSGAQIQRGPAKKYRF